MKRSSLIDVHCDQVWQNLWQNLEGHFLSLVILLSTGPYKDQNTVSQNVALQLKIILDLSYVISVTRRKLPNVYKSCPKMTALEK